MKKQPKKKPRQPKPVLAWCVLQEADGHIYPSGEIMPGWCCESRSQAREWMRESGTKIIRVRIVPVEVVR